MQLLVDASCAPNGTFVCYDSIEHGWNPELNVAVVGGCQAGIGFVRAVDHPMAQPEIEQCNEPNNQGGWDVNCESGYDCSMCGVDVVMPSGERQKVPSTSCTDTGHGCTSRLYNFDCCTAYCDAHGKTGTGCPDCNADVDLN